MCRVQKFMLALLAEFRVALGAKGICLGREPVHIAKFCWAGAVAPESVAVLALDLPLCKQNHTH